jgi:hypothetical protein
MESIGRLIQGDKAKVFFWIFIDTSNISLTKVGPVLETVLETALETVLETALETVLETVLFTLVVKGSATQTQSLG